MAQGALGLAMITAILAAILSGIMTASFLIAGLAYIGGGMAALTSLLLAEVLFGEREEHAGREALSFPERQG